MTVTNRYTNAVCIYCGSTPADAKEHWILRAMGRFKGYEPLLGRVCHGCDGELGRTVDETFCRVGPAALFRQAVGIKGRHSTQSVNPLHYGAVHREPPTRVRTWTDHEQHELLVEPILARGADHIQPLRQIVVEKDGKRVPVPLADGWTSENIRVALEEREMLGARLLSVYCDESERESVVGVLRDLFRPFSVPCYNRTVSPLQDRADGISPVVASFIVDDDYYRAVAKMAFHYLLKWCPAITGREGEFAAVRRFISEGCSRARETA